MTLILACLVFLPGGRASAQDWKRVHKADEEKWAKATGLDPFTIHKIWRTASGDVDEKDDDSRIANLDLEGLSTRRDVLLVTYAGEKNCLTVTVFRQITQSKFKKQWSVQQSPDGTQFCDNDFGTAAAEATDGVIAIRVARPAKEGVPIYLVYAYDWNGITYRLVAQKELQGK